MKATKGTTGIIKSLVQTLYSLKYSHRAHIKRAVGTQSRVSLIIFQRDFLISTGHQIGSTKFQLILPVRKAFWMWNLDRLANKWKIGTKNFGLDGSEDELLVPQVQ